VVNFKQIILVLLCVLVLSACGKSNITGTPTISSITQTPTQIAYPNPIQTMVPSVNSEYPGPLGGSGSPEGKGTPVNYVTQLVVPTPESGKAVITGKLLVGDENGKPYPASLYLASTLPPSTPDYPPIIAFSEQTDQLALQDVDTGVFLFNNIVPGQYAIILWTPYGGNPLVDKNNQTIMFTVNANELKDLGVIVLK
jgi:hypothetical protein